jgi:O-antigen ligase
LKPLFIFFIYLTFVNYININSISYTFFNIQLFLNILVFIILINSFRYIPNLGIKALSSFAFGSVILSGLFLLEISISDDEGRVSVLGINQNQLGLMSAISIFVYISILNSVSTKAHKIFIYLFIAMLSILLIKTGSRTAFISLLIGFMMFLFLNNFSKVKKIILFFGALISSMLIWIISLEKSLIISRLVETLETGHLSARDLIWLKIFEIMKNDFLFGIGETGYAQKMYGSFMKFQGVSPHNVFIETICYTGIFGLIILLIFLFRVFKNSYLNYKHSNNILSLVLLIPILLVLLSGQIFDQKFIWLILSFIAVKFVDKKKILG